MHDNDKLRAIEALLDEEPSASGWQALCGHLAAMNDSVAIERGVRAALERLPRWPSSLRRADTIGKAGSPCAPWLAKLFEGVCDPRLAIVAWASIKHEVDHRQGDNPILGDSHRYDRLPSFSTAVRPVVLAFACHLQADFAPPEVLFSREQDYTSAYGCGGGFETETWGDADRGIRWHATITEHAADDSSVGAWTAYGMKEGMMVKVGDRERGSGTYSFEVAGPTPKVLHLALAWGALLREGPGWTRQRALACLARIHARGVA